MGNNSIRQVRTFDNVFGNGEISSPTGLTFIPGVDVFLTLPDNSENMTAVTSREEEISDSLSINLPTSIQAISTSFDSQFNRLLGLNPSGNKLIEFQVDSKGNFTQSTLGEIDVKSWGIKNARGISLASDGTLYVLDGVGKEILRTEPNADGSFEESTISRIEIPSEIFNPKGIAFNSNTGNLHIYSSSQKELFEVSTQGKVVAVRDLSNLGIRQPEAFIFASSGDLTDNPNQLSLYVADSAPNSGGIVELSWEELTEVSQIQSSAVVTNNYYLVETTDTSQFTPESFNQQGLLISTFLILCLSVTLKSIKAFFGKENLF